MNARFLFFIWAVLILSAPARSPAGETVARVADINPGWRGSFPSYLTVHGGRLFFRATTGLQDTELWQFDGTNAARVADIVPGPAGSSPAYLAGLGTNLYFEASPAGGGIRMHRYDGAAVTQLNVNPPGAFWSLGGARQVEWNGALWWRCLHFQALGIARFDGATISVLNAPPWANSEPALHDGALYYGAQETATGVELWRFNGVSQQRLTDMNPGAGDGSPEALFAHNGALYFRGRDATSGNELWRYDGGAARRVADINPNGSSDPGGFASFQGRLYFAADDGVHGTELFRYDGTTVTLVADINPNPVYELGGDRLSDSWPAHLTVYGGALYFSAKDGTNYGLWRFDGTNASLLGGGMQYEVSELIVFQNALYFDADDGVHGRELWKVKTNAEPRLTIERPAGSVTLQLDEAETGPVIIEATPDFLNWFPIATNVPLDGRVTFFDSPASNGVQRTYRAVRPAGP